MNLAIRDEFDYGIDGRFHEVQCIDAKYMPTGFDLAFQLKCSKNCEHRPSEIIYDCEASTYNTLARIASQPRTTITILLVLSVPSDENLWISVTDRNLILQRACYWFYITGDETGNSSSVRLTIPRTQLFDAETLLRLMEKVKRGTW